MSDSTAPAGYFRGGLPYNRIGHGPRPLVVFQGLTFENKPQGGFMVSLYKFLEGDYTVYVVLRKPGLLPGCSLRSRKALYSPRRY